jgi:hypothetical protein
MPEKRLWCCVFVLLPALAGAQMTPSAPASTPDVQVQRTGSMEQRIPQQKAVTTSVLQGMVTNQAGLALPGVEVRLVDASGAEKGGWRKTGTAMTSGDGIFRMLGIAPGMYDLVLIPRGGAAVKKPAVELRAGEVLSIEVKIPVVAPSASALPQAQIDLLDAGNYKELSRRPDENGAVVAPPFESISPDAAYFQTTKDRWDIPFPDYHRYGGGAETPYIMGHWYDPFNRNILKADKPIYGKTFFSFTADSITALEGRRLPTAAGQSTAEPGEDPFAGKGGEFFLAQTFRFSFDLFHGDTSAFRPVDWRIRVTPAANLNYLLTRENHVVSVDDRNGTTRLDGRVALQEAFGEVKLHDFGPNYDFVNLRAGIQSFVSDFRGFVFADENLGTRIFGNLKSNRYQYNAVFFDLLEKNTNSGLNTFHRRGREVGIANFFMQDFFAKGYTAQFSYHFQRDNGGLHYNDNGNIVRPAPIGIVQQHRVDADYFGWTGDGHIGRINVTHAFYEALGHDTFNPISAQKTGINAQLAAAELSIDKDYLRFRTSFLYASGDGKVRDSTARGFSSIVDGVAFAGGEFSFFNREGIPLTRAGVALKSPDSFLPDLRSDKDEGQSNFVNPGLYLYEAGMDADLLPELKLVVNANYLEFDRTESLEFLLQQNGIRRSIGLDSGIGLIYRPKLSDNIVIHVGATDLIPFRGLKDIYTSQTLVSVFGLIKFQF